MSTYARPEAPQQGNELLAFANALATISPSLNNYLQEEGSRKQQEMEDLANRRFAGMSFEEAQSAVEAGTIREMENPWFQAAFMKQYGERLAYRRINELTQAYETDFDKVGGDLDEFISTAMRADLDQYGDNRFFVSTYNQLMQNFNARAQAGQAEYKTGLMVNETQGGVFDTFLGMTREMLAEGSTPEEVFNAIRGRYGENQQMLHVSFKDQDAELLRVASALAEEGNYEMVQAILRTPRRGEDGTQLGALGDNRDFAADAARILRRAETVMFDANQRVSLEKWLEFSDAANDGRMNREELLAHHEANPGAFSDERVHALIRTNDNAVEQALEQQRRETDRLADIAAAQHSERSLLEVGMEAAKVGRAAWLGDTSVLTEAGGERSISGDQWRKLVAKEIEDSLEREVEAGRSTPEEAFGREVELLSINGLTNERWRNMLAAAPVSATVFTTSGGALPDNLAASLDLYMRLHASNPRLLANHIGNETNMEFFEAYRIARTFMGQDEGQAIAIAQQATNDPDQFRGAAFAQTALQIEQQVQGLGSEWWHVGPMRTDTRNAYAVGTEISRIANLYAALGLPAVNSVKEAKERFEATHTNINGWWINTSDRELPPRFGEWAGDMVNTYVQDFPDEGWDAGELTVVPASNGTGAWMIVHGLTGMPVEDVSRRYFTLEDLTGHQQAHEQAQQLRITRTTNARNAAREQGLSPSPGRPGFFQNHTGVFRAEFDEGSDEPTLVPLERPQGPQGTWDWTEPDWPNTTHR
ncbi:MAG TPA: hypothetical protein VNS12_00785 [Pelagibacterium sp.]|uniref:hypothetical protein n=1 Tax=Pelagibacterium sp. TaxID=1967288 RepID=UPI002D1DA679|nr:hypothetical protein [Pelagibacterium sp.]HWJ86589.1 hypothetical protein [Pelagibacterium sp.]